MEIGEWVNGDLYNGRVVRVANSFVFKAPVYNYSGDFPFLWDEITIPVKYGSDHKEARRILEEIAYQITGDYAKEAKKSWTEMLSKFRIENASVDPAVTFVLNDNWMEFTLRYVVDFKRRRKTKTALYSEILERFEAAGGKIEFASATIQLVDAPKFDVRISGEPTDIK
jgi:small-conductance mechanosensitive channel